MIYFEMGSQGDGTKPESFFPTVESFIGETGTFLAPDALKNKGKGCPAGCTVDGKEAMGAMAFPEITLAAGAHVDYILLGGGRGSKAGRTGSRNVLHDQTGRCCL